MKHHYIGTKAKGYYKITETEEESIKSDNKTIKVSILIFILLCVYRYFFDSSLAEWTLLAYGIYYIFNLSQKETKKFETKDELLEELKKEL